MAKSDDLELLWISYGRGFRRCLEMILGNPVIRVLIDQTGGDAPEIAPQIRRLMREQLIRSTPTGTREGFDSVDDGTLMPGEKSN